MLHSFASWLGTTSLSRAIMDTVWVWPAAEVLHFVGLSLLIGVAGTFDLRLMGFLRAIPLAALHGMTRWAVVGFVINIVTGSLFFIGTPLQYIQNSAFAWKMAFVGIAAGNALIFERLQQLALSQQRQVAPHPLRRELSAQPPWFRGCWCSTGAGCSPLLETRSDGRYCFSNTRVS